MSSNAIESPDSTIRADLASLDPDSSSSSENNTEKLELLAEQLRSNNFKKNLQAVRDLVSMKTEAADEVLVESLQNRGDIHPYSASDRNEEPPADPLPNQQIAVCGAAYQHLFKAPSNAAKSFIEQTPAGIVRPVSDREVDYSELQQLLVQQNYQAADKLTTELMCAIAGEAALKRKWVYFTEVSQFPNADILTIDTLWRTYSEDKFGWSKQRELWLRLGRDWERLWPQIDWQSSEGAWTRYPTEFTWELSSAPIAHLPLFNQLRGVRVMNALLEHPVWSRQTSE